MMGIARKVGELGSARWGIFEVNLDGAFYELSKVVRKSKFLD